MEKKYIAVYAPSNENNQMPSLGFTPRGYMSEEEISELNRNLVGTMGFIHEFRSRDYYESHLAQIDEQWSNDLSNAHHWDGNDH